MTTIPIVRRVILSLSKGAVLLAIGALCACGGPSSRIGLVDTQRIQQNWPKFQNYQNQLAADALALERSKGSADQKRRQQAALQQRYVQDQSELTDEVADAAKQVAQQKNLAFVFTRQYVGYGGVDITADVEKILDIHEKATPSP